MAHARPFSTSTLQDLFQHLKARCFDPWNRVLSFQESRRIPKSPFWECECHPHTPSKWGCDINQHKLVLVIFCEVLVISVVSLSLRKKGYYHFGCLALSLVGARHCCHRQAARRANIHGYSSPHPLFASTIPPITVVIVMPPGERASMVAIVNLFFPKLSNFPQTSHKLPTPLELLSDILKSKVLSPIDTLSLNISLNLHHQWFIFSDLKCLGSVSSSNKNHCWNANE